MLLYMLQINYDPAVYLQIATAAIRASKSLPNKAAGDQLSKVIQGSSEPLLTIGREALWGCRYCYAYSETTGLSIARRLSGLINLKA